ncbi:MAG: DUF3568 family protein [Candidatus Omnitrophica bacterium]|nr:DUF3568 family protein [Candidatus Omnitrophota bacterium]
MRRRIIHLLLACALLISVSGCAPLIIGGAVGALGAYAVSKDTIQGETDKSYESLWESAIYLCRARGVIRSEDMVSGRIELNTESSRVWIRLIRVTRSTVRLRVSARKFHFPNMALAQDIYVKIVEGAR